MTSKSAISYPSRNSSQHLGFGSIQEWKQTEIGLEGKSEVGRFRISVYQGGIIRIQASRYDSFESNPYSVISEPDKVNFNLEEGDNKLYLTTSLIRLKVDLDKFTFSFFLT
ncbi:hypothetical protein [Algoriphagus boritolerans]|uniref:hypothetical protein n=1 Tax=Algoriphagus boritolerans TaxID=308111 RepID=UPI000A6A649C